MPMIVQASGVLLAPAKTATNPSAANKSVGAPSNPASALPSAAPIKNNGVTSPPLNPQLSVTVVNRIFHHQLQKWIVSRVKKEVIVTAFGSGEVTPSPR